MILGTISQKHSSLEHANNPSSGGHTLVAEEENRLQTRFGTEEFYRAL